MKEEQKCVGELMHMIEEVEEVLSELKKNSVKLTEEHYSEKRKDLKVDVLYRTKKLNEIRQEIMVCLRKILDLHLMPLV